MILLPFSAGLDKEEEEEEEEEDNTSMTETVTPTEVQITARNLRAQFAQSEEKWKTNASANPNFPDQSVEKVQNRIRANYPDLELRFDNQHIIDGYARLFDSDGFNDAIGYEPETVNFAVYGKPKAPTR